MHLFQSRANHTIRTAANRREALPPGGLHNYLVQ